MNPVEFPECNVLFRPPEDLDESQCNSVHAFVGAVQGGSLDGAQRVVVAWLPSAAELKMLQEGNPIFLTCLGGLPPHYLSTSFEEACSL